jgi:hypothetical protein
MEMSDVVALIFLAWYLFTGLLFAELVRLSANKWTKSIWTMSYFAIVCGWIAIVPPIVYKSWRV